MIGHVALDKISKNPYQYFTLHFCPFLKPSLRVCLVTCPGSRISSLEDRVLKLIRISPWLRVKERPADAP